MEKLFSVYMEKRRENESFLAYTRRHSMEELKAQIAIEEQK
jgi:hypothetical protein